MTEAAAPVTLTVISFGEARAVNFQNHSPGISRIIPQLKW